MKIATARFGPLEVQEEQVIHMPAGMIGFPDQKRFILLEHKKGSPYLWLQCLDNEALAFVMVDPRLFVPDYEVRMNPEERAALGLEEGPGETQILAVVNIHTANGRPLAITANLLGPVVINPGKRLARQVVLYNQPYSHRHPIPLIRN